MDEKKAIEFFKGKREWSKYKDLILSYYLIPYVSKVLTLGKKVVIFDCCAGPGKYDDGELGSPLIISNILSTFFLKGHNVAGYFIEQNTTLYQRLENIFKSVKVPHELKNKNFKDCIEDISEISKECTVFLYIDPFEPSCLYFDDMKDVYDNLKEGNSVETLINFMGTAFCRGILGSQSQSIQQGYIEQTPQVDEWNKIAGGDYWQQHILNLQISLEEQAQIISSGYADQLNKWFRWSLFYPIKEKYEHNVSKYHLIFGSRSHHAVYLMNDAMVKARREFVGVMSKGYLIDMTPEKEEINEDEIRKLILDTLSKVGKTSWELLRAESMVRQPCFYKTSEINSAIKKAIKEGHINSDCTGSKVVEGAFVWV